MQQGLSGCAVDDTSPVLQNLQFAEFVTHACDTCVLCAAVTADDSEFDFVSRFFGPWMGKCFSPFACTGFRLAMLEQIRSRYAHFR